MLVAGWERSGATWLRRLMAMVSLVMAGFMLLSPLSVVNVLGMASAAAALSLSGGAAVQGVILPVAAGAAALGVFRAAYTGVPAVFLISDAVAGVLGRTGGLLAGSTLNVGTSFGGVDFLLLMFVLLAALMLTSDGANRPFLLYGLLGILTAHAIYLAALAWIPAWMGPPPPPPAQPLPLAGPRPDVPLVEQFRPLVPWNLPAIGAVLHALVAGMLLRLRPTTATPIGLPGRRGAGIAMAAAGGLILAACTSLWLRPLDLTGKKIVFYEKGFLNWLKPRHGDYGRLSIGMYGMMEQYIRSLGGSFVKSPELSAEDLQGASAVVLMFPNSPWQPGQLERLDEFARNGGTLAVFGEHTTHETKGTAVLGDKGDSRFNDVLAKTAMYVPFDSATFQIGGWLHSYEQMTHPASAGIGDDRNQFGVVIGASVKARWPARPFIVGRWGWNDPGDDGSGAAMMGNHHYDAGERLGDLVLAAEQPWGKGRIIAFGDTSNMTNGITIGAHEYTSRLLAYMADGSRQAHPWPKQAVAMLAALAMVAVMLRRVDEWTVLSGAMLLAGGLSVFTTISHRVATILPDGRTSDGSPNQLAYITSSHLEANSDESTRPDGTMGLAMTLMRNGYLTLHAPDLSSRRLERAGLVVCVAPGRPFSLDERRAVRDFIKGGGVFILTVGYEARHASAELLGDLGFWVGHSPANPGPLREPEPMGHFKAPYVTNKAEDYLAHVRFHAAWPVGSDVPPSDPSVMDIAWGRGCRPLMLNGQPTHRGDKPVIMMRTMGKGKFVLIGDTCFAMNKNLEHENGAPFEGMRENADFWRWLLSYLRDPAAAWIPPKPDVLKPKPTAAAPTPPATRPVLPKEAAR